MIPEIIAKELLAKVSARKSLFSNIIIIDINTNVCLYCRILPLSHFRFPIDSIKTIRFQFKVVFVHFIFTCNALNEIN